ncbi:MAG: hypothetical protein HYS26_04845 [Candidatus Kaiserbacteria bacterium]|nr:MAG: hypothetical protein HYS26_04845 [Candidatus Kaiserbacteria bacterium]
MDKLILMIHPTTGLIGLLSAVWVFVEALNASPRNKARLYWGSVLTAVMMIATWIAGGYWYVNYYAVDKALILKGVYPLAHTIVMETKEHAFFITLILSFLLVVVTRFEDVSMNRGARLLVLTASALVVLSAFAIEGAGALIAMAARLSI